MAKKFRICCHLIQWRGEQNENPEKIMREVAAAGYDGLEGFKIQWAEQLVWLQATAAKYGLRIVNAGGSDHQQRIDFNATLGNDASEVPAARKAQFGGPDPTDEDFRRAGESLKDAIAYAEERKIKPFHHAHLGTMIETSEDAKKMLKAAPGLYLLLDTGHLLAAGSDPMDALRSCSDRIGHVHLKDTHANDPKTWNYRKGKFRQDARFAELGAGNLGLDVAKVMAGLEDVGYDGWISVELDECYPPKPPAEAAKANREYLRKLGY
ncbi:MAG: sugar phosphate isomerase/epimerase [Planctomycetota bacterium]